jgi:hypothetical protein
MNLILDEVGVMHDELVKIFGNMISGTGVSIPIGVGTKRSHSSSVLIRNVIIVVVPTSLSHMANLAADLTLRMCRVVGGVTAPIGGTTA